MEPTSTKLVARLPADQKIDRILCLMINGIGDYLCVTPTLRALRTQFPDAQIALVVRPVLTDMVSANPDVDQVILFEADSPRHRLNAFKCIYQYRATLWIDLHVPTFNTVSSNDRDFFRNKLLMICSRAPIKVAYGVPQLKRWLSHPLTVPSVDRLMSTNIVETTLALVGGEGSAAYTKRITITAQDVQWADDHLGKTGSYIGFFTGSRQAADIWPSELALDFLRRVFKSLPDYKVVLIGGTGEIEFASMVVADDELKPNVVNLVGQASFGQTSAILKRCSAFVSTDSGPLHIADAVGTQIVALFSSKNYVEVWRPVSPGARLLNHQIDCGPCFKADCDRDNACMRMITPQSVLDLLREVLQQNADSL